MKAWVEPVAVGAIAAAVALLARYLHEGSPAGYWFAPVLLLGVGALAMLVQRFFFDRHSGARRYDGLADLMIHIHSPGDQDRPSRWSARGLLSFLLYLVGAPAGPEGAAIEVGHSASMRARPRSSEWFEQRRRTDAAIAVAAGISAGFGAPFAGILAAMELGIGGRAISAALAALSALVFTRLIPALFPAGSLSADRLEIQGALQGFDPTSLREWGMVLLIAVASGVLSWLLGIGIRFFRNGLNELFQTQVWVRVLAGSILLFLIAVAFAEAHVPVDRLFESVIWARYGLAETALLLLALVLSFSLVLAAFGTAGVFWPVLTIGALLAALLEIGLFGGTAGLSALAALVGGAALWGGFLGIPLAGGVLAFELTGSPMLLGAALTAAFLASWVRSILRASPLMALDVSSRGIDLRDGRSAQVLDALFVRDAMVSDHEQVHEHEPVSELHQRLLKSRYPFLPVVNSQGIYLGLLTADVIQEGWEAQDPLAAHAPLARLLEAKDLLYRTIKRRVVTVKANDRLTDLSGHFREDPCIPVLGDDGRVLGLVFSYGVRLAYEREVARRSLLIQHQARL